MCGLVGVAGNLAKKEEDVFRMLLILDSLRGEHSTGIASIGLNKDIVIAKSVGDPFQLFETSNYRKIICRKNFVLIGHNRYATTGAIVRKNAHPFENDILVGAHNGTLSNKYALENGNNFEVDSEALLHHISTKGLVHALSVAKGAYALTFYNKLKNTINFVRNKERPLFFTTSENKKSLFWASEKWMLEAALTRSDIKYNPIIELPTLSWISFEVPEEIKDIEFKPHERKITNVPQETPVQSYSKHYSSPVVIQPKDNKTPKKEVDISFLGSVSHTFLVGETKKDINGAEFVSLQSYQKPNYIVRVYPHKSTVLVGKEGNRIAGTVIAARLEEGNYVYRVDISTIKIHNKLIDPIDSFSNAFIEPMDINGNIITEEEFDLYHNTCSWCNDPLDYRKDNLIVSKESGQFCPECQKDPSVKEILSI